MLITKLVYSMVETPNYYNEHPNFIKGNVRKPPIHPLIMKEDISQSICLTYLGDTTSTITPVELDENSSDSLSSLADDVTFSTDESSDVESIKNKENEACKTFKSPINGLLKTNANDIRKRTFLARNLRKIQRKLFYCPLFNAKLNNILEVGDYDIIDILKKIKKTYKISNESTHHQGLVDYIVVAIENLIKKFGKDLNVVKFFGSFGIENNKLKKKVEKIERIMKLFHKKLKSLNAQFQSEKAKDVFICFLQTVELFTRKYYEILNNEKYKTVFPNLQSFIKSIQEIVSETEF